MQYLYLFTISDLHLYFMTWTVFQLTEGITYIQIWLVCFWWYLIYVIISWRRRIGVASTIWKTITKDLAWTSKPQPHITTTRWTTPRRAEDKHTRWPGRNLEGGAFACYVITQLQAYKADNSELINSRVPGATLLTSRCLGQGHNMEVSSPLSNSE